MPSLTKIARILITVLCFTHFAYAQTDKELKGLPPIRIELGTGQTEKKPVPDSLKPFGVKLYDLSLVTPWQANINLYGDGVNPEYVIRLGENIADKTMIYEIRQGSEADVVKVGVQKVGNDTVYTAISSIGGQLKIKISTDSTSNANKVAVKGITIAAANQIWTELPIDSLNRGEAKDGALIKAEEAALFSSARLQVLHKVILSMEQIWKDSFIDKNQRMKQNLITPIIDPEGGCTVTCTRVTAILPIYACDGGLINGCSCAAGSGLFLLSCSTYFSCPVSCGQFGPIT